MKYEMRIFCLMLSMMSTTSLYADDGDDIETYGPMISSDTEAEQRIYDELFAESEKPRKPLLQGCKVSITCCTIASCAYCGLTILAGLAIYFNLAFPQTGQIGN